MGHKSFTFTSQTLFVFIVLFFVILWNAQSESVHHSGATTNSCLKSYSIQKNTFVLDIPEDDRLFSKIANQGKVAIADVNLEGLSVEEFLYQKFQQNFRTRYNQKVLDAHEHKSSSIEIIKDLAANLGFSDVDSFREAYLSGKYSALIQYSNEFKNPITNKGTGTPNYVKINTSLRNLTDVKNLQELPEDIRIMIQDIDQTLNHMPSLKGVVYRGTSMSSDTLKTILESKELSDPAFISTSIDISDAYEFLRKASNKNGKEKVMMTIYTRSGKFIPYGEFSREEEVLIPRYPHRGQLKLNYSFKYTDPEFPDNAVTYLFLTEVITE